MKNKILLSPPHMSGAELTYIQQAFEANWVAPKGAQIDDFEQELAACLTTLNKVVALNSGTSAIHLALLLLGIKKEDRVLCQSFTFAATVNPVGYLGATPVFVDSETDTWNVCPMLLEEAIQDQISKGNKPKAMIVVHGYGMPCKIHEILEIGLTYNIPIVEDAASALGSSVDNQKCGTFGEFGVVSFNGNKIITTSGGGALLCKDAATKQKAVYLATQARDNKPHYQHSEIGYNYRMSNIIAGIGRGQLEVLDERVAARRSNFEFYKNSFKGISTLEFLEAPTGYYANRWLTCITTPSYEIREQLRLALEKENIEARPLWKPMHQQPIFEKYPSYINGVSDDLFERGLCLPSGSNLSEADLQRVCACVKKNV
ncbi:dTDP-4-amino-4,6-dideoxygalactose transaminase [Lutibacter agarilyticus]|uniref:dTDP-4-amino-4,6-dideoxygalactose transaminase n=1 Tax=Lutibacter agarilyticus TaxID=1109740 RepID=A0A238YT70_9FLAO|nr:aminotransferase class I/II-fold pyridoxal phosphate-dependent enzyme [Lutibacter agarilyticus]SNR74476.1 dTDP-4-amino-4,6-dideoxygalactose transaminase [Lutibacter agarilyticus]